MYKGMGNCDDLRKVLRSVVFMNVYKERRDNHYRLLTFGFIGSNLLTDLLNMK